MRPRRGVLGLRGRIVGAVIITTVVTLVVAALALLGPLEHNLRKAELKTFQTQMHGVEGPFRRFGTGLSLVSAYYKLSLPQVTSHMPQSERNAIAQEADEQRLASLAYHTLVRDENALAERVGASEVALVGYDDTGNLTVVARVPPEPVVGQEAGLGDVSAVLRRPGAKTAFSTGSLDGSEYARAIIPFSAGGSPVFKSWALMVRKPFAEINNAVHAVRTAFFDAALAALALTLVLAFPLAFTIVRRLSRLREAALEMAEGGSGAQLPIDRARDEVGDLARAFSVMRSQLQGQEEARRAFVATASHELRTPLTSLEGMLELLEEDLGDVVPDLDDARSLLARARSQSHRLGRLAADLLDLSRIDAQVELRSEPVELGELSRAVLAEFELGTSERAITSELHDGHAPVWALGDPGSVARILRILLDNAMRVSPPGSEITVLLRGGAHASLTVHDHGPGVPAHERDLIFQRFHRGRSTSGQAGFGLGLAIGRELAERMGGELRLEDADEPGARFTLRLPVASAPEHDPVAVG